MRVEACCQALLGHILPDLDPQRQGYCFDVGVGTFAFYCQLFAQLGFPTVAVEPRPTRQLKKLCQRQPIQLLEMCLSDRVGCQTLHLGQFAQLGNANFNSLAEDWFGASGRTQTVSTLDLSSLLERAGTPPVTCLKLDIEGWEAVVLRQLPQIPEPCQPALVMFEYGGGGSYEQGQRGWAPPFLSGTLDSLKSLQQCGYDFTIMIDYAPGTRAKTFSLQHLDLAAETPFYRQGIYGNLLCLRHHQYPEAQIQAWCAPYRGGGVNWTVGKLVVTTTNLQRWWANRSSP